MKNTQLRVLVVGGLELIGVLFKELLEAAFGAKVDLVDCQIDSDLEAYLQKACEFLPITDLVVCTLEWQELFNEGLPEVLEMAKQAGKKVVYVAQGNCDGFFGPNGAFINAPEGLWIHENCQSPLDVIKSALAKK